MTSSSSEVWKSSLNATCNRLSKEYLNLLRAASSASLDENPGGDPRAGGGTMVNPNEPPPTLASDVNLTSLQAKLAAENVCVGKFDKNFFHLSFSQLKLV